MNLKKLTAKQIEAAMRCCGIWSNEIHNIQYEFDYSDGSVSYSFSFGVEGGNLVYIANINNQLQAQFDYPPS